MTNRQYAKILETIGYKGYEVVDCLPNPFRPPNAEFDRRKAAWQKWEKLAQSMKYGTRSGDHRFDVGKKIKQRCRACCLEFGNESMCQSSIGLYNEGNDSFCDAVEVAPIVDCRPSFEDLRVYISDQLLSAGVAPALTDLAILFVPPRSQNGDNIVELRDPPTNSERNFSPCLADLSSPMSASVLPRKTIVVLLEDLFKKLGHN